MKLPSPLRLCLLLTPFVAALPCVEIHTGSHPHSLSLYGVIAGMAPHTGARGWLPYFVLSLAVGVGLRLTGGAISARRTRQLACAATGAAALAVLDLGWPAFSSLQQERSLFSDSIRVEASLGLWLLLLIQILAFVLAWRLPRADAPAMTK